MKRSYECTRLGMGSAEYSWKGMGHDASHDMNIRYSLTGSRCANNLTFIKVFY